MSAPSATEQECCVCTKPSTMRCSGCSPNGVDLFFCSSEHQKLVWPEHKQVCGPERKKSFYPLNLTAAENAVLWQVAYQRFWNSYSDGPITGLIHRNLIGEMPASWQLEKVLALPEGAFDKLPKDFYTNFAKSDFASLPSIAFTCQEIRQVLHGAVVHANKADLYNQLSAATMAAGLQHSWTKYTDGEHMPWSEQISIPHQFIALLGLARARSRPDLSIRLSGHMIKREAILTRLAHILNPTLPHLRFDSRESADGAFEMMLLPFRCADSSLRHPEVTYKYDYDAQTKMASNFRLIAK
ncbi:hypothetical protein JCM10908_000048 [Rhodotorula pacifica]|uniref:zinc finger MYND domain-containing protein n=1 Tax=Rhodotorula pacifica TaxID=1495444 RepID=UPI00316CCAF5